jgi:hypothetical protein
MSDATHEGLGMHDAFGHRFWPPGERSLSRSLRWDGLRRAWRISGHLRALLAATTIFLVLYDLTHPKVGMGRDPGPILLPCLILAAIGFLVACTLLAVLILLGMLQVVTGWPLHDPDAWFQRLPVWAMVPVLLILIVFVALPAIVMVIVSMSVAVRLAGLV